MRLLHLYVMLQVMKKTRLPKGLPHRAGAAEPRSWTMTTFLVSDENKNGFKLEEILIAVRKDIIRRCEKVADDHRPEALHVLDNNTKILSLLSDAIGLAVNSTNTLDKAFGPSVSAKGG
jgi:hypothetical protein